jgi:hypothetical protein
MLNYLYPDWWIQYNYDNNFIYDINVYDMVAKLVDNDYDYDYDFDFDFDFNKMIYILLDEPT